MSDPDIFAQIAALTTLTARDIEDMKACDPNQLAILLKTYENDGKAQPGVWSEVANILKTVAQYAPLAGNILSIVAGVAAL